MTSEFSYPSLRCIWEYMEPNRRIHISSRSPQLRRIDKSIPFHINCLVLDENSIEMNETEYRVRQESERVNPGDERYEKKPEEEILTPGDIVADDERSWIRETTQFTIQFNERNFRRHYLDTKPHLMAKRVANLLLGGRCKIVAKTLQTAEDQKILRLPVGFKVHTSEISCLYHDFPYILPIIESSFVMNEIETYVSKEETFDHPQLRNAKRVIINGIEEWEFMDKLVTLTNEYVGILYGMFSENEFISVIRHWINNGKPNETVWEIEYREIEIGKLLDELKTEFNGRLEQFNNFVIDKRIIAATGYLAIPLNSKFELVVFGVNGNMQDSEASSIRIQTIPKEHSKEVFGFLEWGKDLRQKFEMLFLQ
uniref:FBA_2 domain-containing protein n=1 Tax=Caenorhabditis tropicalis TaxID=1561998 RepID=A0A1I7UDQ6_9PELO